MILADNAPLSTGQNIHFAYSFLIIYKYFVICKQVIDNKFTCRLYNDLSFLDHM